MVAKKMVARILAAALVAFALVPMLATAAFADETVEIGGVQYTLHDSGTASVSGANLQISGPVLILAVVEHEETYYEVTAIDDKAFEYQNDMSSVTFAENSKLATIGLNAFDYCTSLESISIPASVTDIGDYAFNCCIKLSSVAFAEESQLKTIGMGAFRECHGLKSISIPDSVRDIEGGAFQESGLTAVALPEGLTEIGVGLFYKCANLEEVTIPFTVTWIRNYSFDECDKLATIHYGGSRSQWAAISGDTKPGVELVDPGKFDVTFDLRGGSAVDPQVVDKDAMADEPQAPTKQGRMFDHWYTDEALTVQWWFYDAVTKDMTLYAGWNVPMAIGTYNESDPEDRQCGTVDIEASAPEYSHADARTMNYYEPEGETVTFTAKPAKCHVFKGWYQGIIGSSAFVERPTGDPISQDVVFTCDAEDAACICAVFESVEHQWEQKVQKATPTANGQIYQKCSVCGAEETIAPLPKVGNIKLSGNAFTYTGTAIKPKVTVANASEALSADCYTVKYSNNVKVGTASVKVTLQGAYHEGTKTLSFKINKAANTLVAKAKSKKAVAVKAGKSLKAAKLFTVSKNQGKVTYKKAKGNKKITVANNGTVKAKKGMKKGTYTLQVKVTAAGNANYKSATKTVQVKVKVK